jgi:hypothetical protein
MNTLKEQLSGGGKLSCSHNLAYSCSEHENDKDILIFGGITDLKRNAFRSVAMKHNKGIGL